MSEIAPARRDVLKYAGAAGGAAAVGGWLARPVPAFADAASSGASTTSQVDQHEGTPIDTLTFGDATSESAHGLTATLCDTVAGALGQSARVLHPTAPVSYWGGTLSFTMACSPTGTTYVTVKLWGDEYDPTSVEQDSGNNSWRLQLFCEGLQVGYEDQGEVDSLDILDTGPRLPGRFFFHTLPLPEKLTKGKTSVSLEIRSMGRIWSYGQNQAQLYYNQTTDSRGVYRLYTHTDPFITLPANDVQGPVPVPGVRTSPGPEVMDAIKARVQSDQTYLLTEATPTGLGGWSMQSIAEGYLWSGGPAYQSETALDLAMQAIDGRYWAWKADEVVLTGSDQQWQGFGRVGLVLALLWEHLGDRLDQPVAGAPTALANTGFELGGATPIYWTAPGWGTKNATWARDTAVSRSGGASLKLSVTTAGGYMVVNSTPMTEVTAGGTYTFGAWIKTDGAAGQTADIDPLFFDGNGNLVGSDHRAFTTSGAHDWEFVFIDVTVPAGASQASLYLNLNQAGTVWFDDIAFSASTQISNPGFEDGGAQPAGWTAPGWGTSNATWVRDTTVSHSGGASLKLTGAASSSTIVVTQTRFTAVTTGGTYTFGVWIKTDGTAGQSANIDPLFFDASGTLVGSDHRAFTTSGAHDWEFVSIDLTVPAGATQAQVYLNLNGAGSVWFDDVTLTPPAAAATPVPVRRAAYTDMLLSSREYWRQNFPHYSNQTQICATGLYQCNRGLGLLGYSDVWSEDKARSYLYQSIGLLPLAAPEAADGTPSHPLGKDYVEVTAAGLTRELGFVGSYGEVTDWLIMMYESVTRGYQGQQAPELAAQMIKMIKARAKFHPVDVDGVGARVARVETVIGWRNEAYPGIVNYAERTVWDSNPLMAAVTFGDAELIGWTQEMFRDGQFWVQLDLLTANSWDRVGMNALRLVARDWPAYQALPSRPNRLPTGWDEPDFVFTDEENGAIAVKNGREFLYASLYWRARQGVNNYARIHHLTPRDQHSATIREVTGGLTGDSFTVQDWILWDYAIADPAAGGIPPGGFPPPGPTLHQSLAGDVVYKAPVPAGVDPTMGLTFLGVEEPLVGRAPFYVMQYGPYLVAMNTSTDTTFTLPERHGFGPANDLATGHVYGAGVKIPIKPMSTLVLYSQRGPKQHR
jgi:hypothetical protein